VVVAKRRPLSALALCTTRIGCVPSWQPWLGAGHRPCTSFLTTYAPFATELRHKSCRELRITVGFRLLGRTRWLPPLQIRRSRSKIGGSGSRSRQSGEPRPTDVPIAIVRGVLGRNRFKAAENSAWHAALPQTPSVVASEAQGAGSGIFMLPERIPARGVWLGPASSV
jgi:hypothetical protein